MKKIFTSFCCLAATMGLNAQNTFVVSPTEYNGQSITVYATAISENQNWVAGRDNVTYSPLLWNTQTGDVVVLAEEEIVTDYEGNTYSEACEGAFEAVNNAGIAVGSFGPGSGISHAIMCDMADPENFVVLYEEDTDAGSGAYGITEDGSVIVGLHFDENWQTFGCIWTEGGAVRTDLPWPTVEECGFEAEYAAARAISADGSVILGYAQDAFYGNWTFVCWQRQEDGSYAINGNAAKEYFEYDYGMGKPYMTFEPTAFSHNGKWAALLISEECDPSDWYAEPVMLIGRLNIETNELEVLPADGKDAYGIADDGTVVGRVRDEEGLSHGSVWYPEMAGLMTIDELLPNQTEIAEATSSTIFNITGETKTVVGYLINEDGEDYILSTFVAEIPENSQSGIEQISHKPMATDAAYDLMGRRTFNTKGHITIVGGKKNLER